MYNRGSKKFDLSLNLSCCHVMVTELHLPSQRSLNLPIIPFIHHPPSPPFETVRRGLTAVDLAVDGVNFTHVGRDFFLQNTPFLPKTVSPFRNP